MNESSDTIYEKIEQYCLHLMDEREKQFFQQEMQENLSLRKAVEEYQTLLHTFDHQQSAHFIHSSLNAIHAQSRSQTEIIFNQLKLHVNRYWKTASVAASVAFVASILTFTVARSVYKKDTKAQYLTLRNEINSIKKDQKAIKSEVGRRKKNKVNRTRRNRQIFRNLFCH
jgi:anti-sigma-K factor RskA